MHQLIITIMAIVLVSIMALAGISYIPWWYKAVEATKSSIVPALDTLERSYIVTARQLDGAAPDPTVDADGGLHSLFSPAFKFTPRAVPGYSWVYAKHPADGSMYASMHYFCMKPNNPSVPMNEGIYRGLAQLRLNYPASQLIISNSTSCAESSYTESPGNPSTAGSLVFYVSYVPGVSR